ncbi:restriction endonuclease subunit S [Streptomyces sp. G44]|uniref:restriction endonuclease subunit S n=1 Tax=Streptomyces sp. G44 TaxID=2807632 RepID=UPI001961E870|nr:restriction endonuclease subunit S [Streptomyces sp. G44]MBM7172236.1 restriction endonuclease subunit S [Streptomyces sp. G44]
MAKFISLAPDTWQRTTLSQACSAGLGSIQTGPFGSQLHASDYVSEGVPCVMPQDLGDNVIVDENVARIRASDAERLAKYRLQPGDIVYSRRGDVTRRALVRPLEDGWLCGTGCLRVRPGKMVDSRFLSYFLGHPEIRAWIRRHAVGATMPNLNTKILGSVPLVLPSAREQGAIGNVLGALDDKIAVNERIATTAESLLQSKFTALGVVGDSGGGQEIPVSDIISFNPKTAKPISDEPVYVEMAALQPNSAGIPEWTHREPKSGARFQNGDTLLARITPCLENGKTGFVDFLDKGEVGLGSTEFIVMRSRPGVPRTLSYFLARDPLFRAHAIRSMVGTSGRQRVSAADAAEFTVREVDAERLAAFGREADQIFRHLNSLAGESRTLASLRDTLLPQLMSGKIRVRDAEKTIEEAL